MKVIFLIFIDSYHMLYFIIRPIVRLTFRIFFSKIYLHLLERIPRDRPVLISSNHPSAFLEACLLATHFPGTLHFLVRGDIFINKYIIWVLKQLHLSPIYRFADGFKNLRANESTFNDCYKRLANNEILVVYSEGNTLQEKRLRPIQKGLARIAYGALDAFPEMKNLCIVPLGVNYTHPNDFRSEVFVEAGYPIELNEYYARYKEDNVKAISDLTRTVEEAMKPLVIHVNHDDDLPLLESLWQFNKAKSKVPFWPVVERSGERYSLDKKTADLINTMNDEDKSMLVSQIVAGKETTSTSLLRNLLIIPAMTGKYLNWLPLFISRQIATSKVKRIEFFASVLVGTGMFMYLFYLILIALVFHWICCCAWLSLIAVTVTGLIYLYYSFLVDQSKLASFKEANQNLKL